MFLTVALIGMVIASVSATFKVLVPAPPSILSKPDSPALTRELMVSLLAVPVITSIPVVSDPVALK